MSLIRRFALARGLARALLASALFASVGPAAAAAEPAPPATPSIVAGPRSDPAEQLVVTCLQAALAGDFKAWLATLHPNERATEQQRQQLEKYTFKRVAKQAAWYVRGSDASSFEIDRREDMGGGRVKLFLKDLQHPTRAPVPIALEQVSGGGWGIIAISL